MYNSPIKGKEDNMRQELSKCTYTTSIGPVKKKLSALKCDYFLIHHFKHVFWVLKRTINVGTRKRLHGIPRFLILFLGQEILIIIYRTCNIFFYLFCSSQSQTDDTRIVFLAQPAVEHLTVW